MTILLSCVFGCGVSKKTVVQRTYKDTKKKSQEVEISVDMPKIELNKDTKQLQKKGDVTVSCELVSFNLDREMITEEAIADSDPNSPGFDIFEITNKPVYKVLPDEVQFKIKIRNNQDRVLKLVEVPVILIVDGIQTNIPEEQLIDWKGALIVKGFEKEYFVRGPKINSIRGAKSVYIGVHDVPITYDGAGNIKKKENFEWVFTIKNEVLLKKESVSYTYEPRPIYREGCPACNGTGSFVQTSTCIHCKGQGAVKNKDGKIVRCTACSGTGKINTTKTCKTCLGKGYMEYPKSKLPPVAKEVFWTGWPVRVVTNPVGVNVRVVDVNSGQYHDAGKSNISVNWFQCTEKSCPIILELNQKTIKIMPFSKEGKEIGRVMVDFTNPNEPAIIEGQIFAGN